MTDIQAAMVDFAARRVERAAQADTRLQHLKQALIPQLQQAGIASVEIRFDGYGDSGAIEEIECRDAAGQVLACPEMFVAIVPDGDAAAAGEAKQETLNGALESLGYLALERHHPGWEINDGASGALMIDVGTATFMLECSLRYTGYEEHSTEL
jgi:hypothetical protein